MWWNWSCVRYTGTFMMHGNYWWDMGGGWKLTYWHFEIIQDDVYLCKKAHHFVACILCFCSLKLYIHVRHEIMRLAFPGKRLMVVTIRTGTRRGYLSAVRGNNYGESVRCYAVLLWLNKTMNWYAFVWHILPKALLVLPGRAKLLHNDRCPGEGMWPGHRTGITNISTS